MKKLKAQIKPDELFGKVNISLSPANGRLQAKTVYPSEVKQEVLPTENHFALSRVVVEAAPLQAVTLNPSELMQTVAPDANHYGIDSVTVNPAPLQEKTVTPTKAKQTISPDAGYYGMKKVTVEAMADSGALQQKTVSPSAEEQVITPDSGYYGMDSVTVKAAELQEKFVEATDEEQVITADEGYYGLASVTVAPNYNSGDGGGGDSGGTGGGSSSLPNAEDYAFGEQENGYGITGLPETQAGQISMGDNVANEITMLETVEVIGMRAMLPASTYYLCIWDSAGNQLVKQETTTAGEGYGTWVEIYLATPITLEKGNTYLIGGVCRPYYVIRSAGSVNGKIQHTGVVKYSNSVTTPPRLTYASNYLVTVDIILGADSTEMPETYQISLSVMNELAAAVQNATGTLKSLSPAEMISALGG